MKKISPQCAKCTVVRCKSDDKSQKLPHSCPTEKYSDLIEESVKKLKIPKNHIINKALYGIMGKIMNPEKSREKFLWSRIDEIIEYAKIREMKKIGIATCYALLHESKLLTDICESNGFEVASVCCLCGEVKPGDVGLPGNICCNSILQAEVLNHEKTELNIMVGLCLGHDILFLRYAKAETTTLIVKDRAFGHNPIAGIYLSQNPLYKDRFIKK
ncbi:MAG: DUF1847 domain-containing protein [Bacteroidales bacterium]|nr:DUF1847 domain-containing protein [Bacteroidales bacterium]